MSQRIDSVLFFLKFQEKFIFPFKSVTKNAPLSEKQPIQIILFASAVGYSSQFHLIFS